MLKVKLSEQEERMVTQQSFWYMTNFLFTEGNKRFFGQTPSLAGAKAEEKLHLKFHF